MAFVLDSSADVFNSFHPENYQQGPVSNLCILHIHSVTRVCDLASHVLIIIISISSILNVFIKRFHFNVILKHIHHFKAQKIKTHKSKQLGYRQLSNNLILMLVFLPLPQSSEDIFMKGQWVNYSSLCGSTVPTSQPLRSRGKGKATSEVCTDGHDSVPKKKLYWQTERRLDSP